MGCNCIDPIVHSQLDDIIAQAHELVFTDLNNVAVSGGELVRTGGSVGLADAFAKSVQFVEGTGCAYWEFRTFFDDDASNNEIYYVIEDEFSSANRYGWHMTNNTVTFRRAAYHGTTEDFPIYYGPAGGPAPPDQVGYNVGFRFGIYYNNGNVDLWENNQWTNDTEDFLTPESYAFTGLPTDRRWRLRVYVIESGATCHSTPVIESIMPPDSASCSDSSSPSASPSGSGTPSASPSAEPCTPPEGVALACVNARGRLFVTLQDQDNQQIAYAWHEGSTRMQITSMTNWKPSMRALTLQEMNVAFETDNPDPLNPMVISIVRNLRKNYVRDARVNSGSNRIDSETALFDSDNIGDMIAVFGANIGGEGVNYILGRIAELASPSQSPSPSASRSSSPSVTESPSPSLSPSASPSLSRSSSPSPSHSPSESPSASPSRSLSASPSVTPSSSPSASVSRSPSASPSAS